MGGSCDTCNRSYDDRPRMDPSEKSNKDRKRENLIQNTDKKQFIKQNKQKSPKPEEIQHMHEKAKSSLHYISDLVDANAAKETDDEDFVSDDEFDDGDDDEHPTDLIPADKKRDSKRTLLRYDSKRHWDPTKLDEHPTDLIPADKK